VLDQVVDLPTSQHNNYQRNLRFFIYMKHNYAATGTSVYKCHANLDNLPSRKAARQNNINEYEPLDVLLKKTRTHLTYLENGLASVNYQST
jgi:hypothetical protein